MIVTALTLALPLWVIAFLVVGLLTKNEKKNKEDYG